MDYVRWTDEMTLEAMRLRCAGKTNREVAAILGVGFNSVKARFRRLSQPGAGREKIWDETLESMARYLRHVESLPKNWTKDERQKLRRLFAMGLSNLEISEQMPGRTENAVESQIARLALTRDAPVMDMGAPWFAPNRPTETRTYAGCRISVTGDCDEATRAFTARLMACVGYFGKRRAAAKFGAA